MFSHHRRIVNPKAEAVSAATNGNTRFNAIGPTAIAALAPPDAWPAGAEPDGELEFELTTAFELLGAAPEAVWDAVPVEKPDEGADGADGLTLPPLEGELLELEPEVVELNVGAATAVEGSTSAPLPYATVCPFDCSVSWAGVVAPAVVAIEKRPVQVKLAVPAAVNW